MELDELEGGDTVLGSQVQAKWSPRHHVRLFMSYQKKQPVDDSLPTVQANVRQEGFSLGLDINSSSRFALQVGYAENSYSDGNTKRSGRGQISALLLRRAQLFGRISHEFIVFDESRAEYWTPSGFQSTRVAMDAQIDLTQNADLRLAASLPFVSGEGAPGYEIEVDIRLHLTESLSLDLNFFQSEIPGTEGQWSGTGGAAKLVLRP